MDDLSHTGLSNEAVVRTLLTLFYVVEGGRKLGIWLSGLGMDGQANVVRQGLRVAA